MRDKRCFVLARDIGLGKRCDSQASKSKDDKQYFFEPGGNVQTANQRYRQEENNNVLRNVDSSVDKPNLSLVKAGSEPNAFVPEKLDGGAEEDTAEKCPGAIYCHQSQHNVAYDAKGTT
jgi:hypothetical protein